MRPLLLDAYISSPVNRDISEQMKLNDPSRVTSVLRLLAANQSGERVKARVSKQTGIPENTLVSCLSLLSTLYLVSRLPPWTAHWRYTSPESRRQNCRPTVSSSVNSWKVSWQQSFRLFSYRNSNNREVDCLVELNDGRVIAIEMKTSSTARN